jgi:hypothetical protein
MPVPTFIAPLDSIAVRAETLQRMQRLGLRGCVELRAIRTAKPDHRGVPDTKDTWANR